MLDVAVYLQFSIYTPCEAQTVSKHYLISTTLVKLPSKCSLLLEAKPGEKHKGSLGKWLWTQAFFFLSRFLCCGVYSYQAKSCRGPASQQRSAVCRYQGNGSACCAHGQKRWIRLWFHLAHHRIGFLLSFVAMPECFCTCERNKKNAYWRGRVSPRLLTPAIR